jgi:hypothetical protein
MKPKHPSGGVIQFAPRTFAQEQGRAGTKSRCDYRSTFIPDHGRGVIKQCELHARHDISVLSSEAAGRHFHLWTIFASHDADALALPEDEIADE